MEKMTIKSRVMDFVTGKGEAKYTDIIKFIVEDIHGMTYDKTLHRGYYSCAFSSNNPYFLHPSKNDPRYLVKNKETKKYHVVGRNESLKLMKETEVLALEHKNFTNFYYYLKESINKNYPYGIFNTKAFNPDLTDLNVLMEGWNKYIDRTGAWTWTIDIIKGCKDPKSRHIQIWIGNPVGDKDHRGRILRDYKSCGQAYVDESNGHVIVKDNAGMIFMELLMATFGTEFVKNNLTWE
jgi:hypothetical protein